MERRQHLEQDEDAAGEGERPGERVAALDGAHQRPHGEGERGGQNAAGDVKAVQKALGITADGLVGPQTIAAIAAFQKKMGMAAPDGRVDKGGATERALSSGAQPAAAPPPAAPAPPAAR